MSWKGRIFVRKSSTEVGQTSQSVDSVIIQTSKKARQKTPNNFEIRPTNQQQQKKISCNT